MEILALAGQNGIPHRPVQQTRAERGVKASNGIGTPGGLIDTAQSRRLYPGEERQKFAEREIILGTFGGPEDIGNAVTPWCCRVRAPSPTSYLRSLTACLATRSQGRMLQVPDPVGDLAGHRSSDVLTLRALKAASRLTAYSP